MKYWLADCFPRFSWFSWLKFEHEYDAIASDKNKTTKAMLAANDDDDEDRMLDEW